MKILIFLFCLILIIQSCRKPYDNSPAKNGISNLVIEATITNEPPPYIITLSSTISYNNNPGKTNSVSNAKITITDDKGNIETAFEQFPNSGIYETSGKMQGQIGTNYKITIQVNKKTYESEWELMHSLPLIDSIYSLPGFQDVLELAADGTYIRYSSAVHNYYCTFKSLPNEDYYYKIKPVIIYETDALFYPERHLLPVDSTGMQVINLDTTNPLNVYTWTNNYDVKLKLVSGSSQFIKSYNNYLFGYAIYFNPLALTFLNPMPKRGGKEFPLRLSYNPKLDLIFNGDTIYSYPPPVADPYYKNLTYNGTIIGAEIYSVSKTIFSILQEEISQSVPSNSIFDPIPTQISTNIICISDLKEKTIGYFSAASVSRKFKYYYWNDSGYSKKNFQERDITIPIINKTNGNFELTKPNFWTDYLYQK